MNNFLNLSINSYNVSKKYKKEIFYKCLLKLHFLHLKNCKEYKSLFKNLKITKLENFPFLSIRLFKFYELMSTNRKKIYKIFNSSGTTSKTVSKVYIDKKTSEIQRKTLSKIFKDFYDLERSPMLFIDNPEMLRSKINVARKAAISGFMQFGSEIYFALDSSNNINLKEIKAYLKSTKKKGGVVFGFTNIFWKFFFNKINSNILKSKFQNSILIHGGGWKDLNEQLITNHKFKNIVKKKFGFKNISNYYGLIEQPGSIFFECENGFFHTSIYSEIFIRGKNLEILEEKKIGFIHLLSLVPRSYPGNSLITEDLGYFLKENLCKCGRSGKIFKYVKRVPYSEIRGCGNV